MKKKKNQEEDKMDISDSSSDSDLEMDGDEDDEEEQPKKSKESKKTKKPKKTSPPSQSNNSNDDVDVDEVFSVCKTANKNSDLGLNTSIINFTSKKKRKISPKIRQLMIDGRELFFAQKYSEAIPIFLEVIRLDPNYSEPYTNLGLIYENLDQPSKAVECKLINAMLSNDDEKLRSCKQYSMTHKFYEIAVYCLSRLIRRDANNHNLIYEKSVILLSHLKKHKEALKGFEQLLKIYPKNADLSQTISEIYLNKIKDKEKAIEILKNNLSITLNFSSLNMLTEIYMMSNNYNKTVDEILSFSRKSRKSLKEFPLEILANYSMSLLKLNKVAEGNKVIDGIILKSDIHTFGDLFSSIADTYYQIGDYVKSNSIYLRLWKEGTRGVNRNVLAKYVGNCYNQLGDYKFALKYYNLYIKNCLFENSTNTRIKMSEIYKKFDMHEKALSILNNEKEGEKSDDDEEDEEDEEEGEGDGNDKSKSKSRMRRSTKESRSIVISKVKTAMQQSLLLNEQHKSATFLEKAGPFITTLMFLKKRKEKSSKKNIYILDNSNDNDIDMVGPSSGNEIPINYWRWRVIESAVGKLAWSNMIFIILNNLMKENRHNECRTILKKIEQSKYFRKRSGVQYSEEESVRNKKISKKLKMYSISVLCNLGRYSEALSYITQLLGNDPENNFLWNKYTKILFREQSYKKCKIFLQKVQESDRNCLPSIIMLGHVCLMTGSYVIALGEYFHAYSIDKEDPLINLCIGICFLNLIRSKTTANRHLFVAKAFSFLFRYYKFSKDEQEKNYNLGRAFHSIGLYSYAIQYYEKVLTFKSRNSILEGILARTDLRQEAAFNLSKIYEVTGNMRMAKKIIFDNIVV